MKVASETQTDQKLFDQARNWEVSRTEMIQKSERRAWTIAKIFGIGFTIATAAAAVMLVYTLFREPTPFLVREDKVTGATDLVTVLNDKSVGYDEVRDKYFLALYVTSRESYQWYTIQKDYDTVRLMSADGVGKSYKTLFSGDKSLDKLYGAKTNVTVKILSVVPSDGSTGIGTVRFVKTIARADDPNSRNSKTYVATIGYEYRDTARLRETSRLINPFGFTAVSYRADPETVGGDQ